MSKDLGVEPQNQQSTRDRFFVERAWPFGRPAECLPGIVRDGSDMGAMQALVSWNGDPTVAPNLIPVCIGGGGLFQTIGSLRDQDLNAATVLSD